MARRVPVLTQLLGGALAWFAELPNRQSATAWSRDCQTLLGRLGWLGNSGEPPARALDAWNRAWTDFATLSPVIGNVTFDEALTAVRSILTRSRQVAPIPLRGITVLSAAEDLGPGYDAAWMLGVTDTAWPRPATPNPLLPHALQAAHEMPYATPALSLQRCRALIQRLRSRVPELVMSYPLRDDDLAAAPSPFLGDFAWAEALPPNLSADAGVSGLPELHVIDDPAPRFDERVLSGGAATLRLQARCPLRAFIERRLDARPLEVLHRGLSGRHRGIATHRAVELLYARYRTREELGGLDRRTLETAVRVCADQALNDLTRGVRWALSAFVELEHERLERALLRLVEADLRRAEYTVEQLESKIIAEINGLQVSSRIDRIDRLAAGDSAIIDYKTGSRATPADWFKDRLIEPQLPLYAYSVSAPVGALAFAAIRATDVTYRGVWLRDGEFKGSRSGAVTQADWERQQLRWTEQLETLVDEFRRGDTRILVALRQDVEGSLAPLSRVFEQLAAAEDI
jgi:probable DNA repair protein